MCHRPLRATKYNLPTLQNSFSLNVQLYLGFSQIFVMVQISVLGPRLILSIREYHDEEMTQSDERTDTSTMVFQGLTQKSTGSSV